MQIKLGRRSSDRASSRKSIPSRRARPMVVVQQNIQTVSHLFLTESDSPDEVTTESFLWWMIRGDMNTSAACVSCHRRKILASYIATSTNSQPRRATFLLLTFLFQLLCKCLDELHPIRIRHQEHAKSVGLYVSYVLHWANTHCLDSQNATMFFFILSLKK